MLLLTCSFLIFTISKTLEAVKLFNATRFLIFDSAVIEKALKDKKYSDLIVNLFGK